MEMKVIKMIDWTQHVRFMCHPCSALRKENYSHRHEFRWLSRGCSWKTHVVFERLLKCCPTNYMLRSASFCVSVTVSLFSISIYIILRLESRNVLFSMLLRTKSSKGKLQNTIAYWINQPFQYNYSPSKFRWDAWCHSYTCMLNEA